MRDPLFVLSHALNITVHTLCGAAIISYGSLSHWSTCAMSSLWLTSCEIANIMPLTYRSAFQFSAFAEVHFSKTPSSTVLIKCTWTATMHLINAFCLFRSIRRASLYLKNTERKQCYSSLFIMWCHTCESKFLLRLDGALDRYIMTDLLHRFSACVCVYVRNRVLLQKQFLPKQRAKSAILRPHSTRALDARAKKICH